MINTAIKKNIEEILGNPIIVFQQIFGGCINQAFKISTSKKMDYFIKINQSPPIKMFEKEASGLMELKKASVLKIPEVIQASTNFLILEYIYSSTQARNFWEDFGRSFAMLHKYESDTFGFRENNYIGSNQQINLSDQRKSWVEFFFENRLLFQFKLAEKNNLIDPPLREKFIELENKIHKIIDINPASSLLHGDLWSGNFLVDQSGKACLIDPAIYYGHREADLAMTKLFGGFSNSFYASYSVEFPLEDGYEFREPIYKLYHVLNHLNLFGPSYYHQAEALINFYLK